MGSLNLNALIEQLAGAEADLRKDLAGRCVTPECAEARLGLSVRPGGRVVDLVTGQEGEVLNGYTEHIVISTP